MEGKLSGFSQCGLLGRGIRGYLEMMSRKGVCVVACKGHSWHLV